jgi:hypothetical protein
MGTRKNIENYIQEIVDNARRDRTKADFLLNDVISEIQGAKSSHTQVGIVAAKYLETLQKSNDQLVKVASLLNKRTSENVSLSDGDKSQIFEIINSDSKISK